MGFTAEQQAAFDRDGYIIVSGLFTPEQIEAARAETERITYGKSFAEHLADFQAGKEKPKTPVGRIQFPTGSSALDSLIENEDYLDCFAGALGTSDMTYCNAHLFVRFGQDDSRLRAEPWQDYHIDNNTCSFLPPHPDTKRYAYINSWVFLHDIEESGAPLHVCPGSHHKLEAEMQELVETGDGIRDGFRDIRTIPEFGKPIPALGKAGDVLLYSSYLVHGAVEFADKNKQRAVWTLSLGRTENDAWTKFNHLYPYPERPYSIPFWTQTSPSVRSLFGWPAPGDPYYTPKTLKLLAAWYPEMDITPYYDALLTEVRGIEAAIS
jgi:hypothetical protein